MSVKDSSGNEIINVVRRANHGAVISYRNIDYTMARHDGRYEQTFAATNTLRTFKDETTGELSKNFKSLKCHKSRNLFDISKITENKYVYGGNFNDSTASDISEYISILNGLTYTLSWNVSTLSSSNQRQIGIYDNQKQYLGNIQYSLSGRFLYSFTVDIENAAYIVITVDKGLQNIMLNTGTSPLPYEPYGELYSADLKDYRIYGDTSKNILPLSKTPKTETIGDILCEYDGKGTFTFTSTVDNPTFGGNFVVPLEEEFTFPASISDGGTGCIQLNNDFSTDSYPFILVHFANIDEEVSIVEALDSNNMLDSSYDIDDLEGQKVTSIIFQNLHAIGKRTIKIQPALYLGVSQQVPFEPYGESVGDRTENLFDEDNVSILQVTSDGIKRNGTDLGILEYGTYTFSAIASGNPTTIYLTTELEGVYNTTLIDNLPYIFTSDGYSRTMIRTAAQVSSFEWSNYGYSSMMVNSGSTVLPYEPYGYRVPVKVEGKNLFDEQNATLASKYIRSDGTEITGANGDKFRKFLLPVISSCSYTFSWQNAIKGTGDNPPYIRIAEYDNSGNFITRQLINTEEVVNNNVTIISNDNAVKWDIRVDDITSTRGQHINGMMIEKGSNATPYEPYQAPVTTNLYLPEQIKMVGDEAEYIDFGQQKQHRVRKNLWSGNVEQGSVSQSGNYDSSEKRIRSKNIPLEPGTYKLTSNLLIRIIYAYNDTRKVGLVINNGADTANPTFTVPNGANNVSIGMMKKVDGAEVNVTPADFEYGQIEKGSTATPYEPYITDTELDVTLPALPTLYKTNTISVESTIAPSRVDFTGHIKNIPEVTS